MKLRPTHLRLARRDCRTRLPFRFGIATMTSAPMLVAEVAVETGDGAPAVGYAADLLVPKWFAKDPATSHDEDRAALEAAAERAFEHMRATARAERGATVGRLWWRAQLDLVDAADADQPPLVRMFGVALIERALIDATCRAAGVPFEEAVRSGLLGSDVLREVDPSLGAWDPASLGACGERIRVRHTVGLSDALDASDLEAAAGSERADDHPVTLEEDVAAYGLGAFKVKVSGDAASDLPRLERVAALTPDGAEFTLDGNEQFERPGALADLLDELQQRGRAERLLAGLRAIEQPVPRAATFDAAHSADVARLSARAPVIIDEADATLDSLPRALDLGYGGVSVKACKGVTRALLARARLDVHGAGVQSGEDLTNLPTMPLLQDLALARLLGLRDVERNGHHYFRGMAHLSEAEQRWLTREHADLFHAVPGEGPRLTITDGSISLASVGSARGFGYAGPTVAPPARERQGGRA